MIKVEGLEDMNEILQQLIPREARNLSRAYVFGLAQRGAKYAKVRAPKRVGTLRKAIKAKRVKSFIDSPRSDVVVEHGKGAKNDGFYWRFVEYGTKAAQAKPFIQPARDQVYSEMDTLGKQVFLEKLKARIKREQRKRAKRV